MSDLDQRLEAALFAAGEPLDVDRLIAMFDDGTEPNRGEVRESLQRLQQHYRDRGIELKRVGSGYRFQVIPDLGRWVSRLWQEKPARYSRALLETLAIIAYRQPVTRAEIEQIRGVSVSTPIMKTLLQREWVRSVGQRDVPGRPSVYGTTKAFLDHFNLATLADLPPLEDIRDIAELTPELDFSPGDSTDGDSTDGDSTDGDSTDGDSTDGDSTDGDSTDGDSTDGDTSSVGSAGADPAGVDSVGADSTGNGSTQNDESGVDSDGTVPGE